MTMNERIMRGRSLIAHARAAGTDTTAWDAHLAALEIAFARHALVVLLPLIHRGCRLGIHTDAASITLAQIRAARDAALSPCRESGAGNVRVIFAALVAEYRTHLALLERHGQDVFCDLAALELALAQARREGGTYGQPMREGRASPLGRLRPVHRAAHAPLPSGQVASCEPLPDA